jgi:hypothetical protein
MFSAPGYVTGALRHARGAWCHVGQCMGRDDARGFAVLRWDRRLPVRG